MVCISYPLALTRDAVDNIPGVPRLRFRGAAFVARSPEEHRETAFLSRRLTGIACDMPLAVTSDELVRRPPDLAAVDALCEALGFGRLLGVQARRIAGGCPA